VWVSLKLVRVQGSASNQQGHTYLLTSNMDFLLSIEKGVYDLLRRVSEDYELDYNELCERYMSTSAPSPVKRSRKKASSEVGEVTMCQGKTAKGQACKKKAAAGCDFCSVHKPKDDADESEGEVEVKMCKGKTAKGQPCKKKGGEDGYCKVHKPLNEDDVSEGEGEEEEVKKCQALTGKKQPCKKKALDGCDYCAAHKNKLPFKMPGQEEHTHEPDEECDDCDACSQYGDPVNSPDTKRKFKVVTRRSERLMKLAEAEQETMDEDEDLEEFAKQLQAEMEASGVLEEVDV